MANRESANRSRLRKLAEANEALDGVAQLTEDIDLLEQQLQCLVDAEKALGAHNATLQQSVDAMQAKQPLSTHLIQAELQLGAAADRLLKELQTCELLGKQLRSGDAADDAS